MGASHKLCQFDMFELHESNTSERGGGEWQFKRICFKQVAAPSQQPSVNTLQSSLKFYQAILGRHIEVCHLSFCSVKEFLLLIHLCLCPGSNALHDAPSK
jgi:hypothetical protein